MDWKSILKFDKEATFSIKDMCCFDAKIDLAEHPMNNRIPDFIYDDLDSLGCKDFYEALTAITEEGMQGLDEIFRQEENKTLTTGQLDGIVKMANDVLKKWDMCARQRFERKNV